MRRWWSQSALPLQIPPNQHSHLVKLTQSLVLLTLFLELTSLVVRLRSPRFLCLGQATPLWLCLVERTTTLVTQSQTTVTVRSCGERPRCGTRWPSPTRAVLHADVHNVPKLSVPYWQNCSSVLLGVLSFHLLVLDTLLPSSGYHGASLYRAGVSHTPGPLFLPNTESPLMPRTLHTQAVVRKPHGRART